MGVPKYSTYCAHWNYAHRILCECRNDSPHEIFHKTLNAGRARYLYNIATLKQNVFCLMSVNCLQVNRNLGLICGAGRLPDNPNLLFITIRQGTAGHCDRMRHGSRFFERDWGWLQNTAENKSLFSLGNSNDVARLYVRVRLIDT